MADGATPEAPREPPDSPGRRGTLVHAETFFLEDGAQRYSVVGMADVVLRHRKTLVLLPTAMVLLVVAWGSIRHRSYTARADFATQSQSAQLSGLADLAARFGVSVPLASAQSSQSPQFYGDLLRTGDILRQAAETPYQVALSSDTLRGDLADFFRVRGSARDLRAALAADELSKRMTVGTNDQTGVVSLGVTTRWAALSQSIADRMLELVNQFNLRTRQTQAAAERRFVGERLDSARAELRVAEDSLRDFLDSNRQFANSPQLMFEHDHLQRRVDLAQQVSTTLALSYEQAKIEEVRNTPVITVVQAPLLPVRPDPRHLLSKAVLALALGLILAILWALLDDFVNRARTRSPSEYEAFVQAQRETAEDLRRLWLRLRRPAGRPAGSGSEEPR
jgi:uncharacterized protein involved in exopolysaccharide biosynthesis